MWGWLFQRLSPIPSLSASHLHSSVPETASCSRDRWAPAFRRSLTMSLRLQETTEGRRGEHRSCASVTIGHKWVLLDGGVATEQRCTRWEVSVLLRCNHRGQIQRVPSYALFLWHPKDWLSPEAQWLQQKDPTCPDTKAQKMGTPQTGSAINRTNDPNYFLIV